jgi:hypothetical protein
VSWGGFVEEVGGRERGGDGWVWEGVDWGCDDVFSVVDLLLSGVVEDDIVLAGWSLERRVAREVYACVRRCRSDCAVMAFMERVQ